MTPFPEFISSWKVRFFAVFSSCQINQHSVRQTKAVLHSAQHRWFRIYKPYDYRCTIDGGVAARMKACVLIHLWVAWTVDVNHSILNGFSNLLHICKCLAKIFENLWKYICNSTHWPWKLGKGYFDINLSQALPWGRRCLTSPTYSSSRPDHGAIKIVSIRR